MRALLASILPLLLAGPLTAQEICDNGIDDDGDGLIDLNDNECLFSGGWNTGQPSAIANGSFEERAMASGVPCCPFSFVTPLAPWMDCLIDWHQPTTASTDYLHTCGFMPEQVVPLPLPDGEACLGTISIPGYREYIGSQISPPLPADVPQVLTFWAASSSMTASGINGTMYGAGAPYEGPWPITLYGRAQAMPFPLPILDCLEEGDGWTALATFQLDPVRAWQPVTIPFTPSFPVSTFILGAGCDLPADIDSFQHPAVLDGDTIDPAATFSPYLLYDRLALTPAEGTIEGITRTGAWCTSDLLLTAYTTDESTDGQWYHNGIAIVGATDDEFDPSAMVPAGGLYSYVCSVGDEWIRSDIHVPMKPSFTATPGTGYSPLEVTFILGTPQNGTAMWDLDGSSASGDTVTHTFEDPGEYTVTLTQEVDGCNTSSTMTIVVQDHVGIAERGNVTTVPIYPNPVNDLVHVEPGRPVEQWRVMNAFGQVVLQGGRTSGPIGFATTLLPSGAYVLLMEGADARMMGRFIKR